MAGLIGNNCSVLLRRVERLAMDSNVVEALSNGTVLIVGDVMLDCFAYGVVERISPEAPVPILRLERETASLGGAGNVAQNVVALNGKAVLIGAVGVDKAGHLISETLCPDAGIDARLVMSASYSTCVKTRFASEGQQLFRVDSERTVLDDDTSSTIQSAVNSQLSSADIMVLSDYAKGVFTPSAVRAHIDAAKAAEVPIIVDPKSADFTIYRHADLITPNASEATAATGHDCSTSAGAGRAAEAILRISEVGAVLITRGADGMTLLAPRSGVVRPLHIPGRATTVADVSGAGDTVTATVALALSVGIDIKIAAELANRAAAITVGRPGTAVVRSEELRRSLTSFEEPFPVTGDQAMSKVRQWQKDGLTVGFTNGCFDLVHPGHVALLRKAREQCDRLVVALNTDASVKRLKGAGRPIQDQSSRAAVIAALRSVDLVTFFDDDTPLKLIRALRPDVLFKGSDYAIREVVGSDVIGQWGGRVSLIAIEDGQSTSRIVALLQDDYKTP